MQTSTQHAPCSSTGSRGITTSGSAGTPSSSASAIWLAMLLPGSGSWRRNPPGTTEDQAAHFMALAGHH